MSFIDIETKELLSLCREVKKDCGLFFSNCEAFEVIVDSYILICKKYPESMIYINCMDLSTLYQLKQNPDNQHSILEKYKRTRS